MILWLLLVQIATNIFFAVCFFFAAVQAFRLGLYPWCALHVVMLSYNTRTVRFNARNLVNLLQYFTLKDTP